ncbi:MAG TPA: hypothetical protein VHG09_12240 [Longimicrobiales bacterium]|nr:hypothetical protein [Longimicrobiales bacterium]
MKTASIFLAALVTVFPACGDVSAPSGASIVLTGGAVADTIESAVPHAVQVEVRNADGSPAGDTWLRLRPDLLDGEGGWIEDPSPKIYAILGDTIGSPSGRVYATPEDAIARDGSQFRVLTDSRGRATVYYRFGQTAGSVYVKAAFEESRDSVLFTALPGAQVGLAALPRDTAVVVGDSYSLDVFPVDRRGNRRPGDEPDAITVSSEPQAVQTDGATVNALSMGSATVAATSPAGSTEVRVSVVPDAIFAAVPNQQVSWTVQGGPAIPDSAALIAADGTSARPIAESGAATCPSWHPSGDRVLFAGLLIVAAGDAQETQLSTGEVDVVAGCGRFSPDGEWIYFDGRSSTDPASASDIWRIRADGTGLQQITDVPAGWRASGASASPDGSRIAYVVQAPAPGGPSWYSDLVVRDVATGATDTIIAQRRSLHANWSPTGEWIAYTYFSGEGAYQHEGRTFVPIDRVALIRPDGSENHDLPMPREIDSNLVTADLGRGVNWSPDGQWLVGTAIFPDLRIKLMNLDGQTVLLNSSSRAYAEAAWKPDQ